MSDQIIVGPVLGFRGLKEGRWHTSALVVLAAPAAPRLLLTIGGAPQPAAQPILLKAYAGCRVWRLEWSVAQTDLDQPVDYAVNESETFRYLVPAQNQAPRICYGSCFGVHNLQDLNKVKYSQGMWKVLQRVHASQPYHLLFMGGDQVYSDNLWEAVGPLRDWLRLPLKKRILALFSEEMQQQVAQFYFALYCQVWCQKRPAALMAQIPTLMMWDDHDIFDGWGSYDPGLQACPVFQGIYVQAREHFRLFQLQARDASDLGAAVPLGQEGFTYAHRLGDLALVALDLRSERTAQQVMSPQTWNNVQAWMEEALPEKPAVGQSGCKHLLVMSGIPLVNANLSLLETALELRPGQQRMEDDLRDQWLSRAHQQERLQLIHRLLRFAETSCCRVTIVSGDAHTASLGYLQSDRNPAASAEARVINQITSSAMVNLPPPALVVFMMEKLLAGKTEEVDRGITARLVKFPGSTRCIIGARNWLSLRLNQQASIWAEWYVEGEEGPYTKVIHPIGNTGNTGNTLA
jgi:hypothetical protein